MKTLLLFCIISVGFCFSAETQCHYIPSTSVTGDTVTFSFSNNAFASFGCAPIDPTFWLAGSGMWVTATYSTLEDYPSFRIWGMNDDDSASVNVNGAPYPLNALTANYGEKVVCGQSPGPDGVIFANGLVVGANDNFEGNYSYSDIQLNVTGVTSVTVTGVSGAGWGFAGILVDCEYPVVIESLGTFAEELTIYPNPTQNHNAIYFNRNLVNTIVDVIDAQGRLLYSKLVNGNSIDLAGKTISPGLYNVMVFESDHPVVVKRFVVTQ